MSELCGITVHGEEGICRFHLAERWGLSKNRINYLVASGQLEAQEAQAPLSCGRRTRLRSLVPMGAILFSGEEEEHWNRPPMGPRAE